MKLTKKEQISEAISWLAYLHLIAETLFETCNKEWSEMHERFFMTHDRYNWRVVNKYYLNGDSSNEQRVWEHCFGPRTVYREMVERTLLTIRNLSKAEYPDGYQYWPKR